MNDQKTVQMITDVVGVHNYFTGDVLPAVEQVQAKCPDGWQAIFYTSRYAEQHRKEMDAIFVGTVSPRTNQYAYPIYVVQKRKPGRPAGSTKPDADKKNGHEISVAKQ